MEFVRLWRTALFAAGISMIAAGPVSGKSVTVEFATDVGNFEVALDPDLAPITAGNFLHYIDKGAYDGGAFYRATTPQNQSARAVKIHILQGGASPTTRADPPIPLEGTRITGLKHRRGTISMARGEPDTATTEFFICTDDEPELDQGGARNADGQGFAAFGHVASGFDIVLRIYQSDLDGESLKVPIMIRSVRRVDKDVLPSEAKDKFH